MRRLALLVLASVLLPAASAAAAPARTLAVSAGQTVAWTGTQTTGLNFNYFDITRGNGSAWAPPGTCTTDVRSYCDTTLVAVTNEVPETDPDGRVSKGARVTISGFGPVPEPVTDFDLLAFESDANGTQGAELARGAEFAAGEEIVNFPVTTTREQPTRYVLVQVVYFVAVQTGYTGTFRF